MVRQRMLVVALGHEVLNDHNALRHDLVVELARFGGRVGIATIAPPVVEDEDGLGATDWQWGVPAVDDALGCAR